ncbi:quinon protein alcohol dehydrogenase-like superfamily [Spinellus fusiger]|nr:quinon protein alcohol dehydrogenase-like superfamily [Spinellus fusiger]
MSSEKDDTSSQDSTPTIHNFLSRHVPAQLSNPRKLCYRHRPDLVRKRSPESFNIQDVQQQMEKLLLDDREAITHIWSLFSAAPDKQRLLILKGLLSTCCMPQLSFLYDAIKPLLRIDFISILPREVSLHVLSYLDATSLCHAAQVSQTWKSLADDNTLWHRMCEQHINQKCTKCGWGLPLLKKRKKTASPSTRLAPAVMDSPLRTACGPSIILRPQDRPHEAAVEESRPKRIKTEATIETIDGSLYPPSAPPLPPMHRPWKEVYCERLIVERNWRQNKYHSKVLRGHTDGVMCVQFCDSINVLMTGSYDKTIRVWNMESGELVRTLHGHTRCVRSLQFDDAKLVTGAMDNTLKIWNWHTGQCIRTLEGHTGGVTSLHFDSRILASGSTDHTIRVWNFEAGECCTLTGHTEWVNSVRIYDECTLVSGSDDATIRIWNLTTRSCVKVLRGHVGQVQLALPSPKGFTHRFGAETAETHRMAVRRETRTPGAGRGLQGISSTVPGCATDSPQQTPVPPMESAGEPPLPCSTLSDAPIIMSGSLDNTIKVWDMNTGVCLRTLFGHVEGVWGLAFDKLRIVSCSHDKTIRIWDTESGRCMYPLEGHSGPVTAVGLSDTKIVSASDDGDVIVWDYGKL